MKTARPFICSASRRFYCLGLGFIVTLENAACDAAKFSGATEGKFKARRHGNAANLWVLRLRVGSAAAGCD